MLNLIYIIFNYIYIYAEIKFKGLIIEITDFRGTCVDVILSFFSFEMGNKKKKTCFRDLNNNSLDYMDESKSLYKI